MPAAPAFILLHTDINSVPDVVPPWFALICTPFEFEILLIIWRFGIFRVLIVPFLLCLRGDHDGSGCGAAVARAPLVALSQHGANVIAPSLEFSLYLESAAPRRILCDAFEVVVLVLVAPVFAYLY